MLSKNKFYSFTLVEVLVALVITVMGVILVANVIHKSQRRVIDIERRWSNNHLVNLATEHYLTFGHKVAPPTNLFPKGASVSCEVDIAPPTSFVDLVKPSDGWVLAKYKISLFLGSKFTKVRDVYKIIPESEL